MARTFEIQNKKGAENIANHYRAKGWEASVIPTANGNYVVDYQEVSATMANIKKQLAVKEKR